MAPKKPKQPTMLQRQRALRKQQQQTKQQASNQLPPKGGTSANTRQARGQRTSTAKAQAANQQRVIARGMEGFVRRGQAMDKLDKAAKGTQGSGTRTAGAGGGLAKRPSSAVTARQSGKPTTTGGRVQQSSSGSASSNRVQQVRVRDLGSSRPNQMSGNGRPALPPGRSGGALSRVASAAEGAVKNAGRTGKALTGLKGGLVGAALSLGGSAAIEAGVNAYKNAIRKERGQQAAESGQYGRYIPGSQQVRPPVPKPAPKPSASNTATRSSQPAPSRNTSTSSGGGSSRSSAPRSINTTRSQTPPAPRFTGTVDEGRKMWAEKYSSSKYEGQAIQKEAKKLLDEMKKRKEDKSNATKAGWDGNKNY